MINPFLKMRHYGFYLVLHSMSLRKSLLKLILLQHNGDDLLDMQVNLSPGLTSLKAYDELWKISAQSEMLSK
jgi:hypothetical protein